MAQTSVSIRMDADLKRAFDEFCTEIGMTMTTAFCVFAKTAVRERKIPFEISLERSSDPFYSAENMALLRASIAQMEATGGTVHDMTCLDPITPTPASPAEAGEVARAVCRRGRHARGYVSVIGSEQPRRT